MPKTISSLADLGSFSTTFCITRPDGVEYEVPLRILTESEMWDVRQGMNWPRPPLHKFAKLVDDPSQIVQVPDPQDAGYQRARDDANRLFNYRLLVQSLTIEIAGASVDAKVETLKQALGNWAVNQLIRHLLKTSGIEEAEVEEAATSFQ